MLMQSDQLASCVSGQSPGEAALLSSPCGCRLTKENDWRWYQHSHFTDLCCSGCQLGLSEKEEETMFYCASDKMGTREEKRDMCRYCTTSHAQVSRKAFLDCSEHAKPPDCGEFWR